jgi:hypothetical protein
VLVVTSWDISLTGSIANESKAPQLRIESGGESAIIVIGGGESATSGSLTTNIVVPHGVAVRPGVALCAHDPSGGTFGGVIHGFLAKDK